MKVVFDAERLRNLNSGLGQFCRAMGDALVRHRPQSGEVQFIVPPANVGIFGSSPSYVTPGWWHRFVAPCRADVWHMAHQDAWIRPPHDARVVLSIMDLNFLEREDYSAAKKASRLAAVQSKVDRASAIATISAYTESVVRAHLTIPDIPVRVIHLGNPISLPADTAAANSANAQPIVAGKYFIFVGVIHPKKNLHVVLPLLRELPDWSLVIAGPNDHPYASQIRAAAETLGVERRVIMPGAVDDATKRRLYANAGALLFPSLSEGFGLPVIEAMSFGKPVFLSRLTSLPEVGGPLAYYFDSFEPDAVIETVRSGLADFARHPGRPAQLRDYAARFSWDSAASAYWALYREALQSPPR